MKSHCNVKYCDILSLIIFCCTINAFYLVASSDNRFVIVDGVDASFYFCEVVSIETVAGLIFNAHFQIIFLTNKMHSNTLSHSAAAYFLCAVCVRRIGLAVDRVVVVEIGTQEVFLTRSILGGWLLSMPNGGKVAKVAAAARW